MKLISSDLLKEFSAILLYFLLLIFVAVRSYNKTATSTGFIIGNRSMNFWLTALAAHASDMSSWLFMGYPAMVFSVGLRQSWAGIGLLIFMFLNWQLIAPRIRIATEDYNSLTFSSFFENRLADTSGWIRIITALMLLLFYTIYISAALVGIGLVLNTLFNLNYHLGIIIGILIAVPYVFFGGYLTLAWIDLFQGVFLLCVIVFVPLVLLPQIGNFSGIVNALHQHNLSFSFFEGYDSLSLINTFFLTIGWGLGYFGQPHIITKFMGIRNISEIGKSKIVGMTWMTTVLTAATLIGLIGVPFFNYSLTESSNVFILMVRETFSPFLVGLILCAIFAATINAMSSMILVLSSSMTEDLYKKWRPHSSSKTLLKVSKANIVIISLIAFFIANARFDTIYGLVLYAWSGLGAAFGPLLLLCLYMKKINKYGAWTGILVGGIVSATWPIISRKLPIMIPPLPPAFILSFISIFGVSKLTQKKSAVCEHI